MVSRTVSTKIDLENAKNDKVEEIIVIGKLADDLNKSKKIAYVALVH